jgi:hypothetical protein
MVHVMTNYGVFRLDTDPNLVVDKLKTACFFDVGRLDMTASDYLLRLHDQSGAVAEWALDVDGTAEQQQVPEPRAMAMILHRLFQHLLPVAGRKQMTGCELDSGSVRTFLKPTPEMIKK